MTITIALEAFNKEGSFKKRSKLDVNLHSISHANYGGNAGMWRLMEIMDRNDVRSTVVINGLAAEKWPDLIMEVHEQCHEIAGHGMTNEVDMVDLTPEGQRAVIRQVNDVVKATIGVQPVGWLSPGGGLHTAETVSLLADEGYTWSGDLADDDVPYIIAPSAGQRLVIIPKSWFYNDIRAWNGGASSSAMALKAFTDSFDYVYQESLRGRSGRIDVTIHAEYGGRPYLANGFEQIIRYVKQFGDEVWITTYAEMAEYMLANNAGAEIYKPLG